MSNKLKQKRKEKDNDVVRMVIGKKVWEVSRKMAMTTIEIAKQKYKKQNVNAIVGVEKDSIISLQRDVYDDTAKFEKEIENWQKGGFKCYYTYKQ